MPSPTTTIQEVDVLIAGSGSAGLAAATWLSIYGLPPATLNTTATATATNGGILLLDKRPGPMEVGQADGVQCRTVEIFESFGLSEELLRDAYHVLEVAFWRDEGGDGKGLTRTGRTMDTEKDLSWQPHVILNQARVNGLMLGKMRANGLGVEYGWDVRNVELEEGGEWVLVTAERTHGGSNEDGGGDVQTRHFRARYVLACDGAHSQVRRSLGIRMLGDSSDAVWGVMDVYPRTNFPDIRKKATLHSKDAALLIIPREGGSLCRFYIELPPGTKAKDVTLQHLHTAAKKMFAQYELEIADTYWWSAYSIGQRLAEKFSVGNRIFLTGDAAHTHSPKAGQGMNVSLQDGYNIGWKLGMLLTGQADASLLTTYDIERGAVAKDLIDFDKRFTQAMSPRHAKGAVKGSEDPEFFAKEFIKAGRYTAGLTARYVDSVLTDATGSVGKGELGRVVVGMRCPSAQVVRFCDAKAMQLAQGMRSDGRWRLVIFAGDIAQKDKAERLNKLATYLSSPTGPIPTLPPSPSPSHTSENPPTHSTDIDSQIDPLLILSTPLTKIEQSQIHPYFWPPTGKHHIRDLHKTYVDDESYNSGHGHAYRHFGIDEHEGAVLVCRPDNYIAKIVGVADHEGIGRFFAGVFGGEGK